MPHIADTYGSYHADTLKQSMDELLGLARGLIADQVLSDSEIGYLNGWLDKRDFVTSSFPGNVIHQRIREVLADGMVTEEERAHLVDTLKMLIEGRLEDVTDGVDLSEFWFDEVGRIDFHNTRFCLTGNFVYGPMAICKKAIEDRGGSVSPAASSISRASS